VTQPQALKENTKLAHPLFPINIFHNSSRGQDVLHLHWHEHIEIILMLRGEAVFHIGNQAYLASGADFSYIGGKKLAATCCRKA
jgi:AraC family transcriptional activator of pobA